MDKYSGWTAPHLSFMFLPLGELLNILKDMLFGNVISSMTWDVAPFAQSMAIFRLIEHLFIDDSILDILESVVNV